jgi:signal transduction histidine kinase
MSSVNLRQLVEEVCQIVSLKKHSPQIVVSVNIQADIYIQCDRENLLQVFLNCLLNAFDAIESKDVDFERQVSISAEKIVESGGGQADILISIEDTGTGIEEKDLEVIFEPFFTKKDPGKGTGLGLFVSHSIIDSHGGKIWMESTFGQGSTIYIRLPQSTSSSKKERNETSDH